MQPWTWALIIIVVLVVAVAAWAAARQRRSATLKERFGPEYDRTLEGAEDRRAAESELADRARRREKLDVVPLPESARVRYAEQWRAVQERFVDDPPGAVASAQALLDQVMADRGYPTADFEEQADLVSVDHPHVVENYRAAHQLFALHRAGQATTEDLRGALVRYRSLFEDLLRPGTSAPEASAEDAGQTRTPTEDPATRDRAMTYREQR